METSKTNPTLCYAIASGYTINMNITTSYYIILALWLGHPGNSGASSLVFIFPLWAWENCSSFRILRGCDLRYLSSTIYCKSHEPLFLFFMVKAGQPWEAWARMRLEPCTFYIKTYYPFVWTCSLYWAHSKESRGLINASLKPPCYVPYFEHLCCCAFPATLLTIYLWKHTTTPTGMRC